MKCCLVFSILLFAQICFAANPIDSYIDSVHYEDGDKIPYLLTTAGSAAPKYILVLMPGGAGLMNIRKNDDGTIQFDFSANFLIRSRTLIADGEFAAISLDADRRPKRMRAVINDLKLKYSNAKIYIVGTSRSTLATIYLSENMDGEVSGFIHTASMSSIGGLNTKDSKSRNLIVTHKNDGCRLTPPSSSIENHDSYGTDLIVIDGGIAEGDPCQAMGHHGFNGVEAETIQKMKNWIKN